MNEGPQDAKNATKLEAKPETRPVDILLVENSEDDLIITRLAFRRAGCPVTLHHVSDGGQCLDFLHQRGAFSAAPAVELVLLDLNMPGMDGRATLSAITADPALQHLPVVVLSTSDYERDVWDCYRLRCSSFLTKPIDLERFAAMLKAFYVYWFDTVQRPNLPAGR